MHRTRVIQRGVTLAAALGSTLVATLALSPHVLADQSPYTATASAAALRYSLADPQIIPLLQGGEIDISSPMAQVAADTVGGGQGIASLLYPGDDIVGIGGLIGSALPPGTPAPQLPPYPVTVKADPGTPNPPSQQAGGYSLSAALGAGEAKASAIGGLPDSIAANTLNATTHAEPTADGGVSSTATSTITAIGYGNLLSLGSITSTAMAERTGDGTLKRSSHLTISGANILGLPLELSDGNLVVPLVGSLGGKLPVNQAISRLATLAPLKKLGLTLSIESAYNTDNGIVAPTIKMTFVRDLPALKLPAINLPTVLPAQPAIGPIPPSTVTITETIGYAEAEATLTPLPTFPSSSGLSTPTPVDTGVLGTGVTSVGGGGLLSPGTSNPLTSVPSTSAAPSTGAQQAAPQLVGYRLRAPFDALDIYLAIVVVGLIALGTGQLARLQGVKTPWKS